MACRFVLHHSSARSPVSTYDVVSGVASKFDQSLTGVVGTLDAGVDPGPGPSDFLPFSAYPRYDIDVSDAIYTALGRGKQSLGLQFEVTGPSFVAGEYRLMHFILLELWQPSPIPEPATYALMLTGIGVTGFVARRKRRSAGP